MCDEFTGRVILVTGGGCGIGTACCRPIAKRGARVALADADVAAAKSIAAEIGPSQPLSPRWM